MNLSRSLAGGFVCMTVCGLTLTANSTVTRTVSGSSYIVNVDGTDADTALTQEDYTALLGGGTPLNLVKTGKGRLYIPFEMTNTVNAALNWKGSTIVSNGYLRADKVGSLGDKTGSLTVVPGASFEINWKVEFVGTPMQQRRVFVGGIGVDNERGAIRSWTGDMYALGNLDFTANTYVNDMKNGKDIPGQTGDSEIGVRYYTVNLNGHSVTIGGAMRLCGCSAINGSGKIIADKWTALMFEGAVAKHDPSISVEIKEGAVLKLAHYAKDYDHYYTMPLKMRSGSSISAFISGSAQDSSRLILAGWGGPIELVSGTVTLDIGKDICALESTASAAKAPFRFNNVVTGNATLSVKRGIAWFRSEGNAFSGLELTKADGYVGRVKLRTADSVLRVRTFKIEGVTKAAGTYTPTTNPNHILQGSVIVDPNAPVTVSSGSSGDQFARLNRKTGNNMTGVFTATSGRLDVSVTGGGSGVLQLDDNSITGLLDTASVRLDATSEKAFLFESATDASGHPHVETWYNLISSSYHATKWKGEECKKPEVYGTNWFRAVRSTPTLQDYRFNNVTMKYVDFGVCEKVNMNCNTTNESTSAMNFTVPALQEVHVVHADAHLTTKAVRNVLLGMTWKQPDANNTYVGCRGGDKAFFSTDSDKTPAYRDGRLYVDNELRGNSFVPAEDDVHVYTIMPTNALSTPPSVFNGHNPGTLCSGNFSMYGGARIGEILVYKAKNTEADRAQIDAYLLMKWTGKGAGPQIPFGKITLADGVNLTLAGYTRDSVKGVVSVRGLAGNGTVDCGADTLSCDDLSAAFTSATACGCVHVNGTFVLPASGTLTVTSSVRPKAGDYVVFSADSLSGGENLANWTVKLAGACAAIREAKVFVRGNDVILSVPQPGFSVIVR